LKHLFALDGEVAVVTGALGKLGGIWIEALLEAGAAVFGTDLPDAGVSADFSRLQARYDATRLRLERADIRDRPGLEALCGHCRELFGIPSVLVNNAGIDRPPAAARTGCRLEDIPLEENLEIFTVNTLGLFLATQVFGGRMAEAGRGSIINIGSLYASVAPDTRLYRHIQTDPPFLKPPGYGASKAAVVNLTRYLATLWAGRGVRVNALSPGGVLGGQDEEFKRKYTERVPLGRMASAQDLAGPLLFLASPASSYVTGTELIVDGGFTAW
jgi:NAD(P)-dependent dehydrogenase (short-subunit alcohol dehydrogenase family)